MDVYVQKIVQWVVKLDVKGAREHVKVPVANKLCWDVMVVTQCALLHAQVVKLRVKMIVLVVME